MVIGFLIALAGFGQGPGSVASGPRPDVRCGAYCLFVALQALEIGPSKFEQLEASLGPPGPRGYSLLELQKAADGAGAFTLAVETSLENLRSRGRPFACIGIVNKDHFVLIDDITDTRVSILDFPRTYETSLHGFRAVWDGKALLIGKSPLVSEDSVRRSQLVSWALPLVIGGLAVGVAIMAAVGIVRRRLTTRASFTSILLAAVAALAVGGCDAGGAFKPPAADAVALPTGRWLIIPETQRNLGTIFKKHDKQEESFTVRLENHGPGVLVINAVTTSCTCTRATLSREKIPPGESSILTTSIRIGDNLASNSARVYLSTSDPVEPRREILATWLVDLPLRPDRPSLELPPLAPGEAAQRAVPVRLSGLTLCLSCRLAVRTGSQLIDCLVTPLPAERDASHAASPRSDRSQPVGTLHVAVRPRADENFSRDTAHIELLCKDERRASFSLPVSWAVAPVVQATPRRHYVGEIKPGELITQRVVVQSRSGQPFRVVGVGSTDSITGTGAAESPTASPVHHLELFRNAPSAEGQWRYVAHIQTDHPGGEDVVVGFSGVVGRGALDP